MKKSQLILCGLVISLLQACATVPNPDPADPWEGMNRKTMAFNDEVDKYILKPVAKGYQWITPEFLDIGITNFFSNFRDIGVSINDLLQAKPKQCGMDAARFLVNTTIGIAGFVDVATMINLPKHQEDFAQTMAVWGIPRGPYLVIPVLGPSSVRGLGGYVGDVALHPLSYTVLFANPVFSYAATGMRGVDLVDIRADFLGAEEVADEAAVDRYIFFRSAYLQRRDYLISDGEAKPLELEDLDDEGGDDSLYEGLE